MHWMRLICAAESNRVLLQLGLVGKLDVEMESHTTLSSIFSQYGYSVLLPPIQLLALTIAVRLRVAR